MEQLIEDFEKFEMEITGQGEQEKWHALVHEKLRPIRLPGNHLKGGPLCN
ncbi:MAG: hypothetical protein AB1585_08845 [Thermodesulfobacteriota bacterium]